jgi:hypothetical protein
MPGETANIAAIARKVASELFTNFGWSITGTENENFQCKKLGEHQKKTRSQTHPCDVVFQYDDPYENFRQYILTDLKSYGASSLTKDSFRAAIRELARAVDCAAVSTEWQTKYANASVNWQVHGLLFIYNHDNKFKHDFRQFFLDESPRDVSLPSRARLYVFGPEKILYLLNVLNDIEVSRGRQELPLQPPTFLYPDRTRRFAKSSESAVARIELLLGPWQILPYNFQTQARTSRAGAHFYYEGPGKSSPEFEFIFDFCFRNQLVKDEHVIDIRMANAVDGATQNFEVAKENFAKYFYSSPDISSRLDRIKLTPIRRTVLQFSTEQIGMEARNG